MVRPAELVARHQMTPLARLIAGLLGLVLFIGGSLAVTLPILHGDWLHLAFGLPLLVLGAAGMYAARTGREPKWRP